MNYIEALSMIFEMGSECAMILLLYMLANGWMTNYISFDIDNAIAE